MHSISKLFLRLRHGHDERRPAHRRRRLEHPSGRHESERTASTSSLPRDMGSGSRLGTGTPLTEASAIEASSSLQAVELRAGYMFLEAESRSWQRFFVILVKVTGKGPVLVYFDSPDDSTPAGKVSLQDSRVETLKEMLMVQGISKTWFFSCLDDGDAAAWAGAITQALTQSVTELAKSAAGASGSAGSNRGSEAPSHVDGPIVYNVAHAVAAHNIGRGAGGAGGGGNGSSSAAAATADRPPSLDVGRARARTDSNFSAVSSASEYDLQASEAHDGRHRRESNAAAVFQLVAARTPPSTTATKLPGHPFDAFNQLFVLSTAEEVRSAVAYGALRGSSLRSVCWKVFLGCVPKSCGISAWPEFLAEQRRGYERLRERHRMVSTVEAEAWFSRVASDDVAVSRRAARHWLRFCAKRELRAYIQKDINRTFGDIPFFHRPEVQDMLLRVLEVWALAHPAISYKQGMNELLAVVVMLLFTEQQTWNAAMEAGEGKAAHVAELVTTLRDPKYMEHDAYLMLDQIMRRLIWLYCPADSTGSSHGADAASRAIDDSGSSSGEEGPSTPAPRGKRSGRSSSSRSRARTGKHSSRRRRDGKRRHSRRSRRSPRAADAAVGVVSPGGSSHGSGMSPRQALDPDTPRSTRTTGSGGGVVTPRPRGDGAAASAPATAPPAGGAGEDRRRQELVQLRLNDVALSLDMSDSPAKLARKSSRRRSVREMSALAALSDSDDGDDAVPGAGRGAGSGSAYQAHRLERRRQQREMGSTSVSFDWTKSITPSKKGSLLERLDRIQRKLLAWADPALAGHLAFLGISGPMFLLRWLRLAFVREFPVSVVWTLWDAVLAQSPTEFELLDCICVAVLLAIREDLLAATDAPQALSILSGGVEVFGRLDIGDVIQRALGLQTAFSHAVVKATSNEVTTLEAPLAAEGAVAPASPKPTASAGAGKTSSTDDGVRSFAQLRAARARAPPSSSTPAAGAGTDTPTVMASPPRVRRLSSGRPPAPPSMAERAVASGVAAGVRRDGSGATGSDTYLVL